MAIYVLIVCSITYNVWNRNKTHILSVSVANNFSNNFQSRENSRYNVVAVGNVGKM